MKTARLGNVLGMTGVGLGIAATVGEMPNSLVPQFLACSAVGGGAGYAIAQRVGVTELPQTVAAFHSLVGVAAAATAIGDYVAHLGDPGQLHHPWDGARATAVYLATFIGSITATGSVVAFGKLQGLEGRIFESKALALPGRDQINMGLGAASLGAMGTFIGTDSAALGGAALAVGTVSPAALGVHMTASIGGADMPVVITVLNSYSGWALVAEGVLLQDPLLAAVGALIGFSGGILTMIMCARAQPRATTSRMKLRPPVPPPLPLPPSEGATR